MKKDWNYVQKQEEKENENIQNEIVDVYYNNEEEDYYENENYIENNEVIEDEPENNNQLNENDDYNKEELNKIAEDIINTHLNIIREAANILSQEGDLVTNIKGVGKKENFTIDEYISGLEKIVDKKLGLYGGIKGKIVKYKKIAKNQSNQGKHY